MTLRLASPPDVGQLAVIDANGSWHSPRTGKFIEKPWVSAVELTSLFSGNPPASVLDLKASAEAARLAVVRGREEEIVYAGESLEYLLDAAQVDILELENSRADKILEDMETAAAYLAAPHLWAQDNAFGEDTEATDTPAPIDTSIRDVFLATLQLARAVTGKRMASASSALRRAKESGDISDADAILAGAIAEIRFNLAQAREADTLSQPDYEDMLLTITVTENALETLTQEDLEHLAEPKGVTFVGQGEYNRIVREAKHAAIDPLLAVVLLEEAQALLSQLPPDKRAELEKLMAQLRRYIGVTTNDVEGNWALDRAEAGSTPQDAGLGAFTTIASFLEPGLITDEASVLAIVDRLGNWHHPRTGKFLEKPWKFDLSLKLLFSQEQQDIVQEILGLEKHAFREDVYRLRKHLRQLEKDPENEKLIDDVWGKLADLRERWSLAEVISMRYSGKQNEKLPDFDAVDNLLNQLEEGLEYLETAVTAANLGVPLDGSQFAAAYNVIHQSRGRKRTSKPNRIRSARVTPIVAAGGIMPTVKSKPARPAPKTAVKDKWEGPLGFEGKFTGDNRYILPRALDFANVSFPQPFRWASEDIGAHDGARVIGNITEISRFSAPTIVGGVMYPIGTIWGRGEFDMDSDIGKEAQRHVEKKLTNGVSLDLDKISAEVSDAATLSANGEELDLSDAVADMNITAIRGARSRSATLVALPAFEGARLAAVAEWTPLGKDSDDVSTDEQPTLVAAGANPALTPAASNGTLNFMEKRHLSLITKQTFAGIDRGGNWHATIPGKGNRWVPMPDVALEGLLKMVGKAYETDASGVADVDKATIAEAEGDLPEIQAKVKSFISEGRVEDAQGEVQKVLDGFPFEDYEDDSVAGFEDEEGNETDLDGTKIKDALEAFTATDPDVFGDLMAELDAEEGGDDPDARSTTSPDEGPDGEELLKDDAPAEGEFVDAEVVTDSEGNSYVYDFQGFFLKLDENGKPAGTPVYPEDINGLKKTGSYNVGGIDDLGLDEMYEDAEKAGNQGLMDEINAEKGRRGDPEDAEPTLEDQVEAENAAAEPEFGGDPQARGEWLAENPDELETEIAYIRKVNSIPQNREIPGNAERYDRTAEAIRIARMIQKQKAGAEQAAETLNPDAKAPEASGTKSGRGPSGKVRNFDAMNDDKFEAEAAKVEAEDNDPEAKAAVAKSREMREKAGQEETELEKGNLLQTVHDAYTAAYRGPDGPPQSYGAPQAAVKDATKVYLQSIDLPEGWTVEEGGSGSQSSTWITGPNPGVRVHFDARPDDDGGFRLAAPGLSEGPFKTFDEVMNSFGQYEMVGTPPSYHYKKTPKKTKPWAEMDQDERLAFLDEIGMGVNAEGDRTLGDPDSKPMSEAVKDKAEEVNTTEVTSDAPEVEDVSGWAPSDLGQAYLEAQEAGDTAMMNAIKKELNAQGTDINEVLDALNELAVNWDSGVSTLAFTGFMSDICNEFVTAGFSEKEAKPLTLSTLRRWAAGGSTVPGDKAKVSKNTQRKAAKALEEFKSQVAAQAEADQAFETETFNWVSDTGGLPEYIREVADALIKKGMTESMAIATAVNTIKRWARGGSAAKGQKGNVSAGTVAKAVAALAEWEAKKAIANATALDTPIDIAKLTSSMQEAFKDADIDGVDATTFEKIAEDALAVAEELHRDEPDDAEVEGTVDNLLDSIDAAFDYDRDEVGSLVASGGTTGKSAKRKLAAPIKPPAAWFDDPHFKMGTPLTVTREGRVFGHLALWGSCHSAFGNGAGGECVVVPMSKTDYSLFHLGVVETAEGKEVPVGRLAMNTGHANDQFGSRKAIAHYENTGLAIADIHAGEDQFGIWIAGALRPDATDVQIRALKASPLSGDWRYHAGTNDLELVMALAVNMPGFAVPRPQFLVASGAVRTLVAAGMVPPSKVSRAKVEAAMAGDQLAIDDIKYLQRLASKERAHEAKVLRQRMLAASGADEKVHAMAMRLEKMRASAEPESEPEPEPEPEPELVNKLNGYKITPRPSDIEKRK